jgi:hypothetical protein
VFVHLCKQSRHVTSPAPSALWRSMWG